MEVSTPHQTSLQEGVYMNEQKRAISVFSSLAYLGRTLHLTFHFSLSSGLMENVEARNGVEHSKVYNAFGVMEENRPKNQKS